MRVTILVDPSHEEWVRLLDAVFGDERFQIGSGILIDRRGALVPQTKDVRAIMRYIDSKEAVGQTRGWALVVSDLVSYGMGRMAQQWSDHENSLGVYRDVESAMKWLVERSHEPVRRREPC